ncbi:ATP-binding cassette domain-containing protein [Paenibacillus thermoaerophilus]|uniref:ATP-binding cassette domain-containing protein n=1 Tax=Paenibacillus thermoaerophilus TaxID=1215385 RepID=A0ABW2UYD1_9BACL|nr:ATP-binding cassette domain-containing protein [Paenibacillus thermoaerophilus]TMV17805.1 ATP-binding cassette domain-containing protein [Paenibacillus thermoaerophilus]
MLEAIELGKSFEVPVAKNGPLRSVRTLFSRQKRTVVAVERLNFSVERGEFVGYIGPNGAGKSTTIKMLCGILHPSSGRVRVMGCDPQKERTQVVRSLGVVFGQRTQLWWDLPLRDSYDILAAIFRMDRKEKLRQLGKLNEVLGLSEFWDTPVRKLSLGQRMRGDLAAALLHDPELLVLDEPTIGMDVAAKREIRRHLRTLNRDFGKTVLLTTHDMDDIEQLCRRVMVINRGGLIYDGGIAELRERIGLPTVIRVTYRNGYTLPDGIAAAGRDAPGTAEAEYGGRGTGGGIAAIASAERTGLPFRLLEAGSSEVAVSCNRQETTAMDVLRELERWGEIGDVKMEEPDFEDVIHRIY